MHVLFRLDAIVTIVDAQATQRYWKQDRYEFPIELQRQALYADLVVMNKVDMATEEECKRLEKAMGEINEEAAVCSCVNANVDLTKILNVKTFDAVRFNEQNKAADGSANRGDVKARGQHTGGISTMHFEVERDVDVAAFGEWLSGVVARYVKGADVLRVKGVLSVSGDADDRRCVVQGVLDTYTIAPGAPWTSAESRVSRLVLIGQKFDREELERGFQSCLVDESNTDNYEPKKER
ncbi:hypothetical protein BBO99_00007605 [Phytophthora kernoviae]|uniref:CobW C-terminal domain-containing protein n=2 Tax=Phytophthora kernoviae TaxID=325452 RepID=A0A3R7JWG1_9STRA|nr:hypothetical protein G195_008643 [Phytophthora kernoviae 00238/432]KAG2519314.1 hypothetical protein JM16_007204 [Phytophthora kernoviae]KAG2519965.1 hypothetical protein JM18_007306 [Phytophthora kernoviae]RLN32384.1 hypothetical protein BBI17_007557 [Phytophthora kernoviae]RLN76375.1 hypothetical protein BBO99_00007605 [Phytophthora kernoviae]